MLVTAALVAISHWLLATPALAAGTESEDARLARDADEPRRAALAERSFSDQPIHLLANVGFGTLVGFLGLTAGYSLHNRLELGGGIGVNGAGVMGGPYVRVRPWVWTSRKQTLNALSLDLGFSMGTYHELRDIPPFSAMSHTPAEDKPYFRGRVSFMQLEVAWETLDVRGIARRLGGGVTGVLNPSNVKCVAPAGSSGPSCGYPTTVFPVLVAGVGVAF